MVRKRAFIHVGMPKTGTSAIQTMLAERSDDLRAIGLLHPDTPDFNRPALMALFPRGDKRHFFLQRRKISDQAAQAMADDLWSQIEAAAGQYDVVLSSEFLFNIGKRARDLVAAFDAVGFDVVFVCYLRHPVNAAVSSAQQSIKMRLRSLDEACRNPRWHPARPTLEPLLAAVGRDRVLVADFDAARDLGAAQHFLDLIGFGSGPRGIRAAKLKTNESLTMDGVLYADWHSRESKKRGKPPFRRRLIFELGGSGFTLPEAALQQIREASVDEVAWVERTFGITLDEQVSQAVFRNEPSAESQAFIKRHLARR